MLHFKGDRGDPGLPGIPGADGIPVRLTLFALNLSLTIGCLCKLKLKPFDSAIN